MSLTFLSGRKFVTVGPVISEQGRVTSIARIPGIIPNCRPVTPPSHEISVFDPHHDDTKYWKAGTTLYFDLVGKQVSKDVFERQLSRYGLSE